MGHISKVNLTKKLIVSTESELDCGLWCERELFSPKRISQTLFYSPKCIEILKIVILFETFVLFSNLTIILIELFQ